VSVDATSGWSSDATSVPVVVITSDASSVGTSAPDSSGSGQGGASTDSAVTPPSNPQPVEAGSLTTSDAGAPSRDAGTSSPLDAGSPKPVDAGYVPPEAAPMCQASACTNYCGLARRCCNTSNKCACMSLLGTCTLPSLAP
jgi:hypothetical protein